MNNQVCLVNNNVEAQKENEKSPETKLKVMEDCVLTDKRIQNSNLEETQ